jgi:hypothetical protein
MSLSIYDYRWNNLKILEKQNSLIYILKIKVSNERIEDSNDFIS